MRVDAEPDMSWTGDEASTKAFQEFYMRMYGGGKVQEHPEEPSAAPVSQIAVGTTSDEPPMWRRQPAPVQVLTSTGKHVPVRVVPQTEAIQRELASRQQAVYDARQSGMSYMEIAALLCISAATAQQHYYTAQKILAANAAISQLSES